MRFWDACALTPLFVTEPRTADLRALEVSDPEIQVWWGSRVEVTSAIFKKVRGGVVSPADGALAATDVEAKFDARYTPTEYHGRLYLDAGISGGQPVVSEFAVPTRSVYGLWKVEGDVDLVADHYDISAEEVSAAVRFEAEWRKAA